MNNEYLTVFAHARPMARHTQHVGTAKCEAIIRLPGDKNLPCEGLHLILTFPGNKTQRVIFPAGDALNKLARYAAMAKVGMDADTALSAPPAVPDTESTRARLEYAARSLRSIADKGRVGLGDSYPEIVALWATIREIAVAPPVAAVAQPVSHLRACAGLHPWQSWEVCAADDPNAQPVYAALAASPSRERPSLPKLSYEEAKKASDEREEAIRNECERLFQNGGPRRYYVRINDGLNWSVRPCNDSLDSARSMMSVDECLYTRRKTYGLRMYTWVKVA